jgi:hypothetical protein
VWDVQVAITARDVRSVTVNAINALQKIVVQQVALTINSVWIVVVQIFTQTAQNALSWIAIP